MAAKNITKICFADAMKEMMKEKELSQIRVKDICKSCGMDRRTFYYHFIDKYDLVAWIYVKNMEDNWLPHIHYISAEDTANVLKKIKED